jgi:phage tail-like protein
MAENTSAESELMESRENEMSRLMDYLPAVYHGLDDTDLSLNEEPYSGQPPFLSYFLLAFEKVLLGRKDGMVSNLSVQGGAGSKAKAQFESRDPQASAPSRKDRVAGKMPVESGSEGEAVPGFRSIEEEVDDLHYIFEPEQTPAPFLTWLAGWAALSLEGSLSLKKRRQLVANIIPLYRLRWTKAYLERLLEMHLETGAEIAVDDEDRPRLQVGICSTIGKDCYLGGGAPHAFRVRLAFPEMDWARIEPQCQLARRVIDLAKPAHTLYELNVKSHRMQVGVHSTVGVDTLLAG